MLDTTLPIELTHQGELMSQDGRKWKAGKYPANSVPTEIAHDRYGKNFEADDKTQWTKVPVLGEESQPEPEVKLEQAVPKVASPVEDKAASAPAKVVPIN